AEKPENKQKVNTSESKTKSSTIETPPPPTVEVSVEVVQESMPREPKREETKCKDKLEIKPKTKCDKTEAKQKTKVEICSDPVDKQTSVSVEVNEKLDEIAAKAKKSVGRPDQSDESKPKNKLEIDSKAKKTKSPSPSPKVQKEPSPPSPTEPKEPLKED